MSNVERSVHDVTQRGERSDSLQVEHIRPKASYPGMLADKDRTETFRTLHRLHTIRKVVRVIPTHDHDAAEALG